MKRKPELLTLKANYENNHIWKVRDRDVETGNEDINDLTRRWFQDASARRTHISEHTIQERTRMFTESMGNTELKHPTAGLKVILGDETSFSKQ